ncbi:M1 family metallopeptidase [candidate division KSB1 bacterium]|nr:M1 family metallopeptidase [candidate division KSB1 bacterium]NIR71886.1 M1 family metallopeptidase [candidate division KSB1 bacterium]NIS26453.1 M1 family metallopeptidase [candidate division KSB1 bacterium]NIT73223.1 M1 family metallopeptidase [candidate division KSB1 bacterium]NIU27137.1 M1 family metallopeptidase [candidate division KSB1 bacterium]
MGGYPVATGIVAIHGQERMGDVPEIHWRWITAHEIGHQYWGEYVLEKDDSGWLWIGLGIYADREYVRARSLSLEKHQKIMERYINVVRKHVDTTVDITPEQRSDVDFDFNNVVIHGKGFSIISALACVLGRETFDRIYRRCLEQFGGRRLGAYEFQAVCEEETDQDLGWFFDQWLRSSRYPSYQITSQVCTKHNDGYRSRVRVESLGTLKMPVPIVTYFEDGTSQRRVTDRLLHVNILEFASSAPLHEVRLDPDGELALVVPPPGPPPMPTTKDELRKRIRRMSITGAGKEALDLFTAAQQLNLTDPDLWWRLGLALYDGSYYPKALIAWRRIGEFAEGDLDYSFISLVWQGHILDLLGRRQDAV